MRRCDGEVRMSMIEQFRRWFQYECAMVAKTIESLESVPASRRSEPDFRRAVSILSHIVAARRIWLERLGAIAASDNPMFPPDSDLQVVVAGWQFVAEHWTKLLESIDDVRLAETIEYKSLDAGKFRNRVEEVLTQLFGHGWYHRGQIAMLVRNSGGQPAVTDFIYWCRQPVDTE